MDDKRFDALITRLEGVARNDPGGYRGSVLGVTLLGFAVLGFVILYALGPLLLLGAFGVAVVLTGGKALFLLLKLGKLILVLAIPAWVMIKSSVQLLFMRFPRPEGRVLAREEALALFQRLDALQSAQNGPRIHHVMIDGELNAAIMQHPRFGLFGWEENYLVLGLPLLQLLTEEEALSVIGHEYGHISGKHGRLAAFVYRMRTTWGNMQELSSAWKDWGSRMVARLFQWYAPYFNAYTFVMARQNEYEADRAGAEAGGTQHAANALMRIGIIGHFEQEEFWPAIHRKIADQPEPIANRSAMLQELVRQKLDEAKRQRYLAEACAEETGYLDTHPALKDRLAAFGVEANEAAASRLQPAEKSAAAAWLGENLPALQQEMDREWQEGARKYWSERHQHLVECRQRLQALAEKETLTDDERWERIQFRHELEEDYDPVPELDELLAHAPEYANALYRRGTTLLERDDEAGIADLEKLMQQDPDAIMPASEAAWQFYRERDPVRAEEYRQRWLARSEYEDRVEQEGSTLPADATLVPHGLDEAQVEAVRRIVAESSGGIRAVYLLRRVFASDAKRHDYVLAFETSRLTLGDKSAAVIKRLSSQAYPFRLFIVYLGSKTYRGFRKSIRKQRIAPIYGK